LIKQLADANDVIIEQSLIAARAAIFETNDCRIPFLLDPFTDGEGRAKGSKSRMLSSSRTPGKVLLFTAADLTPRLDFKLKGD
jgi:hypothetical protein